MDPWFKPGGKGKDSHVGHDSRWRDVILEMSVRLPNLLVNAIAKAIEGNPQLFDQLAQKLAFSDPSFAVRYFPCFPCEEKAFIPAEPDDENTGEHLSLPIPPRVLQLGYGKDPEEYVLTGEVHFDAMRSILEETGFNLPEGDRVLELGCAAGRMLRNFNRLSQKFEVWGTDIDATAILWCQRHLSPPFKFVTNTTFPHLPFEDNYFGLIYAGSVFTHIFDLSDSWLMELKRILRPGGRMYLTVHDNETIDIIRSWSPGHWAYDSIIHKQIMEYEKEVPIAKTGFGEFTVQRDPGFAQVFHDIEYLKKRWGQFLDILSITPKAYTYQTAVTLTKK